MNLLKKITGIVLAAAMVTLSGVPAFAVGGYTEETGLAIPDELKNVRDSSENFADVRMFCANDNGNLEIMIYAGKSNGRRQGSTARFIQYSSHDGGKSWKKSPVAWMNETYESTNRAC